jgi:hypothetical protein
VERAIPPLAFFRAEIEKPADSKASHFPYPNWNDSSGKFGPSPFANFIDYPECLAIAPP